MFLVAESIGIGSCWIYPVELSLNAEDGKALKKDLGIPEGYTVVGSGVFGYKLRESASPTKRKDNNVNIIK